MEEMELGEIETENLIEMLSILETLDEEAKEEMGGEEYESI